MTFQMIYVICQPNLARSLTLVSSAHHLHVVHRSSACRPHEISTGNIFPLKEQTALLKMQNSPLEVHFTKMEDSPLEVNLLWECNIAPFDRQVAESITFTCMKFRLPVKILLDTSDRFNCPLFLINSYSKTN